MSSVSEAEQTAAKCLVCELDQYTDDVGNAIIQEAIADHDWKMIEVDGKYFCPVTHERICDEEEWEEMPEEEFAVAGREYVVKEGNGWKIMLKPIEVKKEQ